MRGPVAADVVGAIEFAFAGQPAQIRWSALA